eukprot:2708656-Pleurochrysis_carterae.AAC.5
MRRPEECMISQLSCEDAPNGRDLRELAEHAKHRANRRWRSMHALTDAADEKTTRMAQPAVSRDCGVSRAVMEKATKLLCYMLGF